MAKKKSSKPAAASPAPIAHAPEPTTVPVMARVELDDIYVDGHNHREQTHYTERVRDRAESFRQNGQQAPILLIENPDAKRQPAKPYRLCYGHIRLDAARLLGWKTIAAEIRPPCTDAEFMVWRAIENLHRVELNIVEKIAAVRYAVNQHGGNMQLAADQLQMKVEEVRDLDYIDQRIFAPARKLASEGKLLHGHLRVLAKVGDPEEQKRLAERCVGIPYSNYDGDEEGELNRWSVNELAHQVHALQRKISLVPWLLDRGFAGKPACDGCKDNTSTDQTLFGLEDAKGNGVCMNPGCFEAKTLAAEKAKTAAAAKLVKKQDASAAAAAAITPEWLKPATVQRLAKKQLDSGEAPKRRNDEAPHGHPNKETPYTRWAKAWNKWVDEACGLIADSISNKPDIARCFLLFEGVVEPLFAYCRADVWDASRKEPEPIPTVTPQGDSFIEAAMMGDFERSTKLYVDGLGGDKWALERGIPHHPAIIHDLAEKLHLKIPAEPKWDDFKPKSNAEAKKKPADKPAADLSDMDLSPRTLKCLEAAGVKTLDGLCTLSEADLLDSMGKTSLREIKRKLAELGRSLSATGAVMAIGEEED